MIDEAKRLHRAMIALRKSVDDVRRCARLAKPTRQGHTALADRTKRTHEFLSVVGDDIDEWAASLARELEAVS